MKDCWPPRRPLRVVYTPCSCFVCALRGINQKGGVVRCAWVCVARKLLKLRTEAICVSGAALQPPLLGSMLGSMLGSKPNSKRVRVQNQKQNKTARMRTPQQHFGAKGCVTDVLCLVCCYSNGKPVNQPTNRSRTETTSKSRRSTVRALPPMAARSNVVSLE